MIEDLVVQYIDSLTGIVLDPRKRLFVGYLLAAVLLGVLWMCVRDKLGLRAALRQTFDGKVWLGASARLDYQLLLINRALMVMLSPLLLSQMAVATFVFYSLHGLDWIAPIAVAQVPGWAVIATFTFVLFVVDDFSRYLLHRLLHRVPVLWSFHKVHHSATTLTPVTVYRTHPVEGLLFAVRATCVQGCVLASFIFVFGERVDLLSVLGVNVFLFAFNAAGSNLRHSHISLGYVDAVENVLMSPAQHQIHHSCAAEHVDKNFGAAFSIWDRWGGTHVHSKRDQRLTFGLDNPADATGQSHGQRDTHSLYDAYLRPFGEAARQLRQAWQCVAHRASPLLAPVMAQIANHFINLQRGSVWPFVVLQSGIVMLKPKLARRPK